MNVYQKLIEVRKEVEFLQKDNQGHGYKYVSSSQTISAVRAKMDELSLLLVPRVTGKEVSDHVTSGGKNWYFTELLMEYTWINADKPDETIACPWYGQGVDDAEKGVGKALTYSEKYFLLKFFNIPTDKDDPDARKKDSQAPPRQKPKSTTGKERQPKSLDFYVKGLQATGNLSTCEEYCKTVWEDAKADLSAPDQKKFMEEIVAHKSKLSENGTAGLDKFLCMRDNKDTTTVDCQGCEEAKQCPEYQGQITKEL